MNEDEAATQAKKQGLTYTIPYDDIEYSKKLVQFWKGKKLQKSISLKQIKNFNSFGFKKNTLNKIFETIEK